MKTTSKLFVMTLIGVFVLAALAQAQTFMDLYNFTGTSGNGPQAGVVRDGAGKLYGTTAAGGSNNYGVVFKVSSSGTETVLYNFTEAADGGQPLAPVIRDSKGNLYGTALRGGTGSCGVVFKVNTAGKESVLHNFAGGAADGCHPFQGVIMDTKGNFYGTTYAGGAQGNGTVFKLTAKGKETLLYSFTGGSDGRYPFYGHLLMDKAGDLYGLTNLGGSSAFGVLYKLTPKGKQTVLHTFTGGSSDGCYPYGSVSMDRAGNLYGTTYACGSVNGGTVWEVSKKGKETILHSFVGSSSDGVFPDAGVSLDSKGNMYGATSGGGPDNDGVVYELSPKGTLTLLHSFAGTDGANPVGEVLLTSKGDLFGTAASGGTNTYGTVWSYVP